MIKYNVMMTLYIISRNVFKYQFYGRDGSDDVD